MKYPRIPIVHAAEDGTTQTHMIEPEASLEMTMHYKGEIEGWVLTAWDKRVEGALPFAMDGLRRWGHWQDAFERKLFEDACYAQYLAKRAQRAAQGVVSAFDHSAEAPWTREELFALDPSGQYVAFVYRSAWYGWKLARGA